MKGKYYLRVSPLYLENTSKDQHLIETLERYNTFSGNYTFKGFITGKDINIFRVKRGPFLEETVLDGRLFSPPGGLGMLIRSTINGDDHPVKFSYEGKNYHSCLNMVQSLFKHYTIFISHQINNNVFSKDKCHRST